MVIYSRKSSKPWTIQIRFPYCAFFMKPWPFFVLLILIVIIILWINIWSLLCLLVCKLLENRYHISLASSPAPSIQRCPVNNGWENESNKVGYIKYQKKKSSKQWIWREFRERRDPWGLKWMRLELFLREKQKAFFKVAMDSECSGDREYTSLTEEFHI